MPVVGGRGPPPGAKRKRGTGWEGDAAVTAPGAVLILVENLPVPCDRRVWDEARALRNAGTVVSVICPKGRGYTKSYEEIEGIHVYRHGLPVEGNDLFGYLIEYACALVCQLALSVKIRRKHGFDVIHACNPPDLMFLIGLIYKVGFRTRFVFDHHDLSPELYQVKFGRQGLVHKLLLFLERCSFRTADISLATNETFRAIATSRGRMPATKVWIVRSAPDLTRFRRTQPIIELRRGRKYLVGYVGVVARQDGLDVLLHAVQHAVTIRGRSDVQWLIIGDGPDLDIVRKLANRLCISDFVTFAGFVVGAQLLSHLSSLDVGVIPDPPNQYNSKVSMNKVFEYMALGIPFVQFDLPENTRIAGEAAEVVSRCDAGALGDAVLDLLDDPGRRAAMARRARERADVMFGSNLDGKRLIEAYRSISGSPPDGRIEREGSRP